MQNTLRSRSSDFRRRASSAFLEGSPPAPLRRSFLKFREQSPAPPTPQSLDPCREASFEASRAQSLKVCLASFGCFRAPRAAPNMPDAVPDSASPPPEKCHFSYGELCDCSSRRAGCATVGRRLRVGCAWVAHGLRVGCAWFARFARWLRAGCALVACRLLVGSCWLRVVSVWGCACGCTLVAHWWHVAGTSVARGLRRCRASIVPRLPVDGVPVGNRLRVGCASVVRSVVLRWRLGCASVARWLRIGSGLAASYCALRVGGTSVARGLRVCTELAGLLTLLLYVSVCSASDHPLVPGRLRVGRASFARRSRVGHAWFALQVHDGCLRVAL